jgi:uncharacterized Ntn-hydrolase superfamily protein
LDVDDGFGAREALRQTRIITLLNSNYRRERVGLGGLQAAFTGNQCAESASVTLPAPLAQG